MDLGLEIWGGGEGSRKEFALTTGRKRCGEVQRPSFRIEVKDGGSRKGE